MATLIGSSTVPTGAADNTGAGFSIAAQYTAAATGTVDTLLLYESTIASPGITGVYLGIFSDSAGSPNALLGQGLYSGRPAATTWFSVTGLSIAVVSGTVYWLAADPVGSGQINYPDTVASGGTHTRASSTGGRASLSAVLPGTEWLTDYPIGPFGFYGTGTASGAADIPDLTMAPPHR